MKEYKYTQHHVKGRKGVPFSILIPVEGPKTKRKKKSGKVEQAAISASAQDRSPSAEVPPLIPMTQAVAAKPTSRRKKTTAAASSSSQSADSSSQAAAATSTTPGEDARVALCNGLGAVQMFNSSC